MVAPPAALRMAAVLWVASTAAAAGQSMRYAPDQGRTFHYRTDNTLSVTQVVLERENHYTLRSGGDVRLTLLDGGPRLLWRVGFDALELRVDGAYPAPRVESLRGTVVTLTTTPQGVVLDALASGVVSPGLGTQYVERAAAAFLPHLPAIEADGDGATRWTDTLMVTEVLQGVTAEVETVIAYTVADTSALAGRPMVPVEYSGEITVAGSGTVRGANIELSGTGTVQGSYLYDPTDGVFALHDQEHVLESTLVLDEPDRPPLSIPSRQVLRAHAERLF